MGNSMKSENPAVSSRQGGALNLKTWLAGMLLHDSGSVCAQGGEQCGDDGDDDLTNPLQGLLSTVFHGS